MAVWYDHRVDGMTKENLGIEVLKRAKNSEFIIKSSLWEGIFVDDNSVNCTSLERRKIFYSHFFEDLSRVLLQSFVCQTTYR